MKSPLVEVSVRSGTWFLGKVLYTHVRAHIIGPGATIIPRTQRKYYRDTILMKEGEGKRSEIKKVKKERKCRKE